jgi:hypothetical protein
MSLVKGKDDERPSWPIVRVQEIVFVYEATELLPSLYHPLLIVMKVPMRATLRLFFLRNQFTAFRELEKKMLFTSKQKKSGK